MSTIIIFNTSTEEVVHVQGDNKHNLTADEMAASWYEYTSSNSEDFTNVIIQEDFTSLEFHKVKAVINDEVIDKMAMPISVDTTTITADGVDTASLTNCPEYAEVFFDGNSVGFINGDGTVVVTMNVPRALLIELKLFPYLDHEVTINGT